MKLSRSQSAVTVSTLLPVLAARMRFIRSLMVCRRFRWMDISVIWPAYAEGLMDHDLGIGQGEPLALGAGREQESAMEAAMPMQMVDTSHLTYCMVS